MYYYVYHECINIVYSLSTRLRFFFNVKTNLALWSMTDRSQNPVIYCASLGLSFLVGDFHFFGNYLSYL